MSETSSEEETSLMLDALDLLTKFYLFRFFFKKHGVSVARIESTMNETV